MDPQRKRFIFFIVCISIIVFCFVLMISISGCSYESRKFRAMIFTIVLVMLFQYLIGDIIKFTCFAAIHACRKKLELEEGTEAGRITAGPEKAYSDALLELKLASYRSQISITSAHYNETLNLRYKLIAQELLLFGSYFLLLLLLVVGSRDYLLYYNSHTLDMVLGQQHLGTAGFYKLHKKEDVYKFLDLVIVTAFNEGRDYNGQIIDEPGWIEYRMAKLLGVVRLRQIRRHEKYIGLSTPIFAEGNYNPRWILPYRELHYTDKYWRIYGPWLDKQAESGWLAPMRHQGHLYNYNEDRGYVMLLSRDAANSKKVVEYIRNSGWLDDRTVALFIDFTLYNVDSNIFSVCTLILEYTPFGNVLAKIEIRSAELLVGLHNMPTWTMFIFLLYALQLIKFTKKTFLGMWYRTKDTHSIWNYVDIFIAALNFVLLATIVTRELKVKQLMGKFQNSDKLEFVDFREAADIDYITNILAGLLICVVTLRLWKILQFAKPFRLFTRTLYSGITTHFTLLLIILVFLSGFSICSYIINGSYSQHFVHLLRSFTSSMSYSFGFSTTVNPSDLAYGGRTIGLLLYALLMLGVSILLVNLFITLICYHFQQSKDTPDDEELKDLSFFEFLKVEYAYVARFVKRFCRRKLYNPKYGSVRQNINKSVDKLEKHEKRRRLSGRDTVKSHYGRRLRHIGHLHSMARVLSTQVEILLHYQRKGEINV